MRAVITPGRRTGGGLSGRGGPLSSAAAPLVMTSRLLIDADVVDQHLRRERRGGVDRAGPVTADRQVENDVERVVVDPRAPGVLHGVLVRGEGQCVVQEEPDALAVPLGGIG